MRATIRALAFAVLRLIALAILLAPAPLGAQAPTREPAFVYAVNAYAPDGYVAALYLPQHDTIYLLADQPSAIAPRNTVIYWWQISNEFRADWNERNELINSTLEVSGNGQAARTFTLSDYIVQFDNEDPYETVRLTTGDEANARYDQFVAARTAYWDAVRDYQNRFLEYSQQLDDAVKNSEGGAKPQTVPEKPKEPAQFTLQSTTPVRAFIVNLPAGEYQMRLRDPRGALLPGLDRKLVVFAARRQAVSYTVVPQSKWTVPEQSDDPAQVIYVPGRATLYFVPFLSAEFNDFYFSRLLNPQGTEGNPEQWRWVRLKPFTSATLLVSDASGATRKVPFRGYRVNQLPGTALGYEVVDFDPKTMRGSPSFDGFKIEVDANQSVLSLTLQDGDGRAVQGSARQVRALQPTNNALLFALPFVALLAGAAMMLVRRRRFAKLPQDAQG